MIPDKVLIISVLGFSLTLTDLDIAMKLLVGFTTLIYVIYKALNEKNKYDRSKKEQNIKKDGEFI
jgi:arginine exporter protein ArgO